MSLQMRLPAARSKELPEGVVIQPRKFVFDALGDVPQYWFADNPILTHVENAFSILIPPGEQFFIRSVRAYQDRVTDPDQKQLIRAFAQQEGLHTGAHDAFNASLRSHGVDIERESAYAERVIARMERWLPAKMKLGATAFLEHLTATGAHILFTERQIADLMHPEMARFWRWHAAEELEHKAVAFDLFQYVGGGYLLRILSVVAAVLFLAWPFYRIFSRMLRDDPTQVTQEMRQQAREINSEISKKQLRLLSLYFRRDFHPWQLEDERHLRDWYISSEAA